MTSTQTARHVKIHLGTGNRMANATVEIDGESLGTAIMALDLHATARGELTLVIDACVIETDILDAEGHTKIYISPDADKLIRKLGWTPPGEAP